MLSAAGSTALSTRSSLTGAGDRITASRTTAPPWSPRATRFIAPQPRSLGATNQPARATWFQHYIPAMRRAYEVPSVRDYGSLMEVTSAVHLLMGHSAGTDLSFSSPVNSTAGGGSSPETPGGPLGAVAAGPTATTGGAHHAVPGADTGSPGGGGVAGVTSGSGGGAGGGGSGGGAAGGAAGELPF